MARIRPESSAKIFASIASDILWAEIFYNEYAHQGKLNHTIKSVELAIRQVVVLQSDQIPPMNDCDYVCQ